ncbi:MAG: dephospho-CoA kinase [Candidatus Obscuribacterales bacterium]|nr:dephospho-CoA kinase [Candidatus Obscuribacterales bacterium]
MSGIIVAILLASVAAGAWYHYGRGKRAGGKKRVNDSILVIGVTGARASGKSLIGTLFAERGIDVIDTDHLVHELLAQSKEVMAAVRQRFGDGVFSADGVILRPALSNIIYADVKARKDLEAILHPLIVIECRRRIKELALAGKKVVAVLVPLLFEAGLEKEYDLILAVMVDEAILRERMKARDKLNDAEVEVRLAAQMPQEEKGRRAHHRIDNSGTIEQTRENLSGFLAEIGLS